MKLEERVEVLLGGASAKEAGAQEISERVWEACLNERSVLSEDRKTNLDYWVSYIAYFSIFILRKRFRLFRTFLCGKDCGQDSV
ncbi:MAG: hypothetical protein ACLTCI_08660 [[Clostridium] nexile]